MFAIIGACLFSVVIYIMTPLALASAFCFWITALQ